MAPPKQTAKHSRASTSCSYSLASLTKAVNDVRNGIAINTTAKKYNIPRRTLRDKISGKNPIGKRQGAPTHLTTEEEDRLVEWILHVSKYGFAVTKDQLLISVKAFVKELKRKIPFKNNRPGRHWYEGFVNRHPVLSERMSQNLNKSGSSISEPQIKAWFEEVGDYLAKKELLNIDATRIYNCDESALYLCPNKNKVIGRKSKVKIHNFINSDECITTFIMANAAGDILPPMILHANKRLSSVITNSCPEGWGIGRSENGWVTGETFYEYITNIYYPWLVEKNIQFPVVLFVDGHSSYLTMHLSKFCRDKGIVLIALYRNATHILQPLDVGFFCPLKELWIKVVHQWKVDTGEAYLSKRHFAEQLKKAIDTINFCDILQSAFKACGLHPFDPDAIKYEKLINQRMSSKEECTKQPAAISIVPKTPLELLEKCIPEDVLRQFKENIDNEIWNGDEKHESLFLSWKKFRHFINTSILSDCTF